MGLVERIDQLLENALPGGPTHTMLLKWRRAAASGTLLGPSIRRRIKEMVAELDMIECRHLIETGRCKLGGKKFCNHLDNQRECKMYEPQKPERTR